MKNEHHVAREVRASALVSPGKEQIGRTVATLARWSARVGLASLAAATLAVWAQTAVTIQPPNLSGAIAGTLAGQAATSAGGAATYSIPFTPPPGTAGMVPSLSLSYSSHVGMASMGIGWRVSGLSQIGRCPKTIVQDGVRRGITLTPEDQFCLDGQRLLMVPGSGTHGATAEYRTQLDAQNKVQSFGSDPAKGPDYFEVRSKAGLILTYGRTADATTEAQGTGKPVLSWSLSRAMDRRGNYYDVRYSEVNTATQGESYPERVLYTGHVDQGGGGGNIAPYNAIRFIYEDRPDLQLAFVAGSRLTNSKRLTALRAYVGTDADGNGGTLAREIRIAYTTNATSGRSLVDRITDCDGAGSCLPPTTFTWTVSGVSAGAADGSGDWGGPPVWITTLARDGEKPQQVKNQVAMGDFNGDGKADLFRGDGTYWQVCLSTGTGFNCSNWGSSTALTREVVFGDFNGDGKLDVATYPKVDAPGNWTVCLSTGTGFNCSAWAGYGASNYYGDGVVGGALVGDFNGDGRDDIAIAGANGDNERMCWSTGAGFQGGTCQTYPGSYLFMYYWKLSSEESFKAMQTGQMAGDIDGDGKTDIIYYAGIQKDKMVFPKGGWGGIRPTDTGFVSFSASSTGQVMLDGVLSPGDTRFTDVTGDPYGSLSDVVNGYIADDTHSARMEICRSDGTKLLSCLPLTGAGTATGPVAMVRDLDGDGQPDVVAGGQICQLKLVAYGANNADQYALSCAQRPPGSGSGGNPTGQVLQSYVGDFDGDGRMDAAAYYMTSSTSGYWRVSLSSNVGFADLLDTVSNGLGQSARFVYKRQSDPTVYTAGSAVSYPKRNVVGAGTPLVSSLQVGNGVGGWLTSDYQYEAARTDLSGRGGLGFEKRRVIDRTKGITTQITVSQDFPTIGMPLETRSTQTNGTVLSLASMSYGSVAMAAGSVCPYPTSATLQTRDLNGAAISTTSSSVASGGIDAYCNVTDVTETVSTSDGASFATRTQTSYLNDTTAWLIGLPANTSVTKTAVQPYAAASMLSLVSCASSAPTNAAATFTCTLANSGPDAGSGLSYASGTGTTASGPASCAGNSANCGAVMVTTSASPGTYNGALTVTPANGGGGASAGYALTVTTPPVLALSSCSSSAPTIQAATMSCRLSNGGQTAANGITYTAGNGVTVSGPSSCAAGSGDCGTVTATTSGVPGVYGGTVTATPGSGGNAASASYSLTVYTSSALTLTGCSSSSPSASAATMSCTLGNTGQTAASGIVYATGAGASANGPATCAANTANCGTVTVTTSGSPGGYNGTLTATPSTGSGASAGYALTVYTPPALTLAGCASSSPTTAAATMSCTLGNSGQTAASGIGYGTGAGASAGGPASCAANTGNCGAVTLTTSGSAGNYGGTLTATPGNGGSGASAGYSLAVYTPPALGLTNCVASAPSNAVAHFTCTLINSGQTTATGVSYGAGAGVGAGGPTTCSAGSSNCGVVTVTTIASPGTYTGTLVASPSNGGSGASAGYSLVVFTPPALRFAGCSPTSPSTAVQTLTCNLANDGQTGTSVAYATGNGTSIGGPSFCAGNSGNCGAVVVTTSSTPGLYSGAMSVTPLNSGTGVGTGYYLRVYSNGTTLTASPMTMDWGTLTGGSPTKSMTITNSGLAPTTLSWTLAYTGGSIGMGNYSVVAAQSSCTSGQALDIDQSCTVTWAMNTQCTTHGVRAAQMKINGGTSQVVVSMSANVQRTTLCQ
ncbi:FG-GAP-like repeat-containing protein [Mitsuaria sp. GD03876]|uniref:FG-GAP-like repeat-containing protein n=1 Tax=Mitsuaria sp. GD03876 TaxID=2975399 RepID=UPI00244AE4C7|nr:FG-GAP-like repeat-containing protein [Mitsuaria sp. GD03876]MDH0864172.1 FG-GAP-like repeat-containing protein [Mitsuaria sp. GD03876]